MATDGPPKLAASELNYYYGDLQALRDVSLEVQNNDLLTIMGPTGSGKTTLLRAINRLNDLLPRTRMTGRVTLDGLDLYDPGADPAEVRRRIGMVFALPIPLPMSVYDNVAYGPRLHGVTRKSQLDETVEKGLRDAILWDEVKDRLADSALRLSGGQQQRLSIARVLAVEPEVILLDEPTSGLDPISTLRIEELLKQLRKRYTIVLVTHNPQQAARVGDRVAFFYLGELVEFGPSQRVFTRPRDRRTEDYISGRFG
ncbi:MAG: phosphate ABC transporter ATP-binding protein PstB [Bacillota bacterium]